MALGDAGAHRHVAGGVKVPLTASATIFSAFSRKTP